MRRRQRSLGSVESMASLERCRRMRGRIRAYDRRRCRDRCRHLQSSDRAGSPDRSRRSRGVALAVREDSPLSIGSRCEVASRAGIGNCLSASCIRRGCNGARLDRLVRDLYTLKLVAWLTSAGCIEWPRRCDSSDLGAARVERERQWPAETVLSKGHRLVGAFASPSEQSGSSAKRTTT
jgi:hypothetical protein